jgi:hypothetical protein
VIKIGSLIRLFSALVLALGGSLVSGAALAGADPLPRVVPGIATLVEGNSGTVTVQIPVTLSAPSTAVVTADWATLYGPGITPPAAAQPGVDYAAASGTVTFAPGVTSTTIEITEFGDKDPEPDEQIIAGFSNATNATIGGFYGLGVGVITNDDQPPVTILPGSASVPEGNTGTSSLNVPVTLNQTSSDTVTVDWVTVVNNGAPACQADPTTDYTPGGGTVTFTPGDTNEAVTITVNGDTTPEPNECVIVSFSNATNARIGGYYGLGAGTILNDDAPPTPPIVVGGDPALTRVTEGNTGTTAIDIPVLLTHPSTSIVSVDWKTREFPVEGFASEGFDYLAAAGTLFFQPGDTVATARVEILGDVAVEPDEIVVIELLGTSASFRSTAIFDRVSAGTIANDD